MKFKNKRLLSLSVASFMFFGLLGNGTVNAFAETNSDEQIVIQRIVDEMDVPQAKTIFNDVDFVKTGGAPRIEDRGSFFNNEISENDDVRFIIEVEGKSVADMSTRSTFASMANDKSVTDAIKKTQDSTIKSIEKMDDNMNVRRRFTKLINGFSVEGKFGDLEKLENLPNVKKVTVANKYYADMTSAKDISGDINHIWNELDLKGEGMVVSIIDTGIDYNHKDMRLSDSTTNSAIDVADIPDGLKGRYFTEKVPYGYNYADDNTQVIPAIGTSSHGMHVAGIVGANCGNEEEIAALKGIQGMAPECQLLAMKVFSNKPGGSFAFSDDVIAAIEDSVTLGADVINMSLGATAQFQRPNDLEQDAVKKATEAGVLVAISAGNSEYATAPYKLPWNKDTGLVGSPGLTHASLQVASYNNTLVVGPLISYKVNGEVKKAPYKEGAGDFAEVFADESGYNVVYCGIGVVEENFEGVNVEGKIALIQRGVYSFEDKVKSAKEHGAIAAIIFNDSRGDELISMAGVGNVSIPSIFIGNTAGKAIKENKAKFFFAGDFAQTENPIKGKMSGFSSWGPTPNLDFKPQISGVGGSVWSTIARNEYEDMSGTSMASPYVAGCAALIKQDLVNKGWDKLGESKLDREEYLKNLLVNTADVVIEHDSIPYSPRKQGAGLINIDKALDNEVLVTYNDESVMALKEMDSKNTYTVTVKNYGDTTVNYKLETIGGVLTEQESKFRETYDVKYDGAKIDFNKETIEVTTKSSVTFNVNINFTDEAVKGKFAEGFIRLVPVQDVPEIGIPFMGFYGEWDKEQIIEDSVYSDTEYIFYDNTTLLNQDGKYINVTKIYDEDGNIIDLIPTSDKTVINPKSDDEKVAKTARPKLVLYRNAEEIRIDVENSEKARLTTVAVANDFSKTLYSEDEYGTSKENWTWDGTLYNEDKGIYEVVPDGLYYINARAKIDYEGAEFQDFRFPLYVDTKAPVVNITSEKEAVGSTYELRFTATDATEVNNILVSAVNEEGKVIAEIEKDAIAYDKETKEYSVVIPKIEESTIVTVSVVDGVANAGQDEIEVKNESFDGLEITSPKAINGLEDELKVQYVINKELGKEIIDTAEYKNYILEKQVEGKFVEVNKAEKVSLTYYTIGKQEVGNYRITVEVLDKDLNLVAKGQKYFAVESKDLFVTFDNIDNGAELTETDFTIEGHVSSVPKEFTINGENVVLNGDGSENPLGFEHKVVLKEGKDKVKFHYVDKDGNSRDFAYNVLVDVKAPTITVVAPGEDKKVSEGVYEVIVDEKQAEYVVSGKVQDDTFGYNFLINGEEVINVESNSDIIAEKGLRDFSHKMKLTEQVNHVELKAIDDFGHETVVRVTIYKGEKPQGNFELVDENDGKVFRNGEEALVTFTAKNASATEQNVAIGIGLFNNKGKMINKIGNKLNIKPGMEVTMSMLMNIPQEGDYTVQCFVWDDFISGNSLSENLVFNVQK